MLLLLQGLKEYWLGLLLAAGHHDTSLCAIPTGCAEANVLVVPCCKQTAAAATTLALHHGCSMWLPGASQIIPVHAAAPLPAHAGLLLRLLALLLAVQLRQ